MKLKAISLMLAAACCLPAAGAKGTTVRVTNATELINAIRPHQTIIIDAKQPLNITEALDQMVADGSITKGDTYYNPDDAASYKVNVTYSTNTDGNTLQVRGCDGLTIRAAKGQVTLLSTPRQGNVLEFIRCSDLNLENIIMGHTVGGYCDKGVLELDACTNVKINNCDLFGCGTEGFVMEDCNAVTVNNTNVHDCTYYTLHIMSCRQVRFNNCVFRDNQKYEQLNVNSSSDVIFTACAFDNLQGKLFNFDDYTNFYSCTFRNCEMEPITSDFEPQGHAVLAYCSIVDKNAPATANVKKPKLRPGRWTDGKRMFRVTKSDDYHYVFRSTEGPTELFGLNCISARANEYIMAPEFPNVQGDTPRLGADAGRNGAVDYVRIVDDGGALMRTFTRVGR